MAHPPFLAARTVTGSAACQDCDYERAAEVEHKDSGVAGHRGPVGLVLEAAQRHARIKGHRIDFTRGRTDTYDGTLELVKGGPGMRRKPRGVAE